ncbi:MAG: integrase/recombinase XerD [bacterium P3]|nr:MAG: integrase/recombinase XerD [bacterium P3]KWW38680.1 MAG: integrase/recombinase XerD [bacterium F083]
MRDEFRRFLMLEKRLAGNSVEAYLRDVDHLMRFALSRNIPPDDVTLETLQQLLSELNNTDIAITTQCRLISGWRSFFHMMVIEDILKDNPASLLMMPGKPRHLPDVLTDSDIDALQATFDLSRPEQFRDYVMIEVLYGCGLRVSELVYLKLSNIYAEEEYLQVFGKGSKERWVPVNRRALSLLDTYIHQIRSHITPLPGEERYIFLSRRGTHLTRVRVFQVIKEAVERAGLQKHVSPHSLRHSFATELVENGADLRAVQEMLGHGSIGTTEIYTHISRQFLRDTIKSYHPHYKLHEHRR